MTCMTPCSLRMQAADRYLQTIASSNVFKSIHTYATKMFTNCNDTVTSRERMEETIMHLAVSASVNVSKKLDDLMKFLTKELQNSSEVLKLLKQRVTASSLRIDSPATDLLLQLIFCSTVMVQNRHQQHLVLLGVLTRKFNHIRVLMSNKLILSSDFLNDCLIMFPKVVVIRAFVYLNMSALRAIRDGAPLLEELVLGRGSSYKDFSDDDFCRIFFAGLSLEKVERSFTSGTQVQISFPKLRVLEFPLTLPLYFSFFKMFLHFYPSCHVDWIPQQYETDISTFDGVLCHTIDLNPTHRLRHCELRYEDLRFPYVDEMLTKWTRLDTVALVYGKSCANIDHNFAKEKLDNILTGCTKVKNFHIMVVATSFLDSCYQTILRALEKHGHRFESFFILDLHQTLTHKHLVDYINCFPNISTLEIHCKPCSRYPKDIQVKSLENLLNITLRFLPWHADSKSKNAALFFNDLLRASPNVTYLHSPIDYYFLTELSKIKFSPKLSIFAAYFYVVDDARVNMKQLFSFIKTLPIKELTADFCLEDREPISIDMWPHVRLRSMLRNTEVVVQGFDVKVSWQGV